MRQQASFCCSPAKLYSFVPFLVKELRSPGCGPLLSAPVKPWHMAGASEGFRQIPDLDVFSLFENMKMKILHKCSWLSTNTGQWYGCYVLFLYDSLVEKGDFQTGTAKILVCWLFSFLIGQNTSYSDLWSLLDSCFKQEKSAK